MHHRHCKFSASLLQEMGFNIAHLDTMSHGQAKHMKNLSTACDVGTVPERETSAHRDHRNACKRSLWGSLLLQASQLLAGAS